MKPLCRTLAIAALVLGLGSTAQAATVDYTTITDGSYSSVSLGGTTVTGSANIVSAYYAGFRGLGVEGSGSFQNGSNQSLDNGETMSIDFGSLVRNATITLVDIDPPGNVKFWFEAFSGITSLGTFDFPSASTHPETFDLFALSGNQLMSRIALTVGSPSAPLGLQIQSVSFDRATAVPEPSTMLLLGSGLAGLATLGSSRRRKQPRA